MGNGLERQLLVCPIIPAQGIQERVRFTFGEGRYEAQCDVGECFFSSQKMHSY